MHCVIPGVLHPLLPGVLHCELPEVYHCVLSEVLHSVLFEISYFELLCIVPWLPISWLLPCFMGIFPIKHSQRSPYFLDHFLETQAKTHSEIAVQNRGYQGLIQSNL